MMNLKNKNILITGAAGGIGTALSQQLNAAGANLALHGLTQEELQTLLETLTPRDNKIETIVLDLLGNDVGPQLVAQARNILQGLDMVINLAGMQTFKALDDLTAAQIDMQIALNLTVPIHINQAAAAIFMQQHSGTIVNIGSTFGSIGFAQFSVYSASKFGLRGFTEALRREMQGRGVDVVYIAPRATQTALNSSAMYEMAEKTKMNIDTPAYVAAQIIWAIEKQKKNTCIGFPEKFFCKVNALFPSLVDKALAGQNKIASGYAKSNNESTETIS
jgi:short-subunit dehydrogenase